MSDYKYNLPKLNRKEFEVALEIYIQYLKDNSDSGWIEGVGFIGGMDFNQLKKDIMSVVESQGVGEWIPYYKQILALGAPHRLSFETNEQYQDFFEDWQDEVARLTQEQWQNQFIQGKEKRRQF